MATKGYEVGAAQQTNLLGVNFGRRSPGSGDNIAEPDQGTEGSVDLRSQAENGFLQ